ncbi:MAG: zinc ribbon domain-containing protein [Chloroflexia bacterium]|nr:zinc ribbon domain-containing protein [Chloroflexia bacterium]MDQ3512814.1 zinc ribbon domain-containing protein [Chloroflexota bacterium]
MDGVTTAVARGAQVLLALGGAYVAVLWFASIVWTFRDIEARSRNVITQVASTLLSVLFPFIGIPLYMILRPKDTLDGSYQRSLEEEYLLQDLEELPLCPTCQRFVEDDFVLCPHCHGTLREPCLSCARLVDLRWSLCPYCGTAQDGRSVEPVSVTPERRWVAPRRRSATPVDREDAAARGGAAVPTPLSPRPEPNVADEPVVAAASRTRLRSQGPSEITELPVNGTAHGVNGVSTGRFTPPRRQQPALTQNGRVGTVSSPGPTRDVAPANGTARRVEVLAAAATGRTDGD